MQCALANLSASVKVHLTHYLNSIKKKTRTRYGIGISPWELLHFLPLGKWRKDEIQESGFLSCHLKGTLDLSESWFQGSCLALYDIMQKQTNSEIDWSKTSLIFHVLCSRKTNNGDLVLARFRVDKFNHIVTWILSL